MTDSAAGATRRRGDVFTLYAEIYALRLSLGATPAAATTDPAAGALGSGACDTDLSAAAAAPSPPSP
jgi:hypothetical protein